MLIKACRRPFPTGNGSEKSLPLRRSPLSTVKKQVSHICLELTLSGGGSEKPPSFITLSRYARSTFSLLTEAVFSGRLLSCSLLTEAVFSGRFLSEPPPVGNGRPTCLIQLQQKLEPLISKFVRR